MKHPILATTLVLAAQLALAGDPERALQASVFQIRDAGQLRTFSVATDEIHTRDANGKTVVQKLAAPAGNAEAARAAARAAGGGLVFYEQAQKRDVASRRLVSREVLVQLAAGVDADAVAAAAGGEVSRRPGFAPGFVVMKFGDSGAALNAAADLRAAAGVRSAEPMLQRQHSRRFTPNDPLFSSQWHLKNTGQGGGTAGVDVNVSTVWDTYKGGGITIGIIDDGMQFTHPDISPNANTAIDHDWNDGTPNDPSPDVAGDFHGTACAGVAAGRGNNTVGVSGAAPESALVGLRLIAGSVSDADEAEALDWESGIIDIKSNSWGPFDDAQRLEGPGPLTEAAMLNAVTNGRGGKGSIITWAGGNGLGSNDNSNYDGYANSIYAVAIGAITNSGQQSGYSEPGANLVVGAPSNGGSLGIVTTDLTGTNGYNDGSEIPQVDYTNSFGGTSSATPLASGVIALILDANPNLGWRDVKEILITTATQVNPSDAGWVTNAAGFHFNHKFGAGMINAQAAVNAATGWTNLAAMSSDDDEDAGLSVPIPDNNATGITHTFTIADGMRVEHAVVEVDITHTYRGDLEITLTSPSGTASKLAEKHGDSNNNYTAWRFSTVRSWGEPAPGNWTLHIADKANADTGTLTRAKLTLFGVAGGNAAPYAVNDSASLGDHAAATIPVLANDGDSNGDTLSIIALTAPANGTATITGGGTTISYDPSDSFGGGDSFKYTISDGNGGTHTGLVSITVPAPAGTVITETPFVTGDRVFGTGSTPGGWPGVTGAVPPAVNYTKFGIPSINDAGQMAFLATLSDAKMAIVAGNPPRFVAKKGDSAGNAGASGRTFNAFKDPALAANGGVAFIASLAGGTTVDDTAIFTNVNGELALTAREGSTAPGVPGATFKMFSFIAAASNGAGEGAVAFVAKLNLTGGVTSANDTGLWIAAGGTTTLVLREGAPITLPSGATTVTTFSALATRLDAAPHGNGLLAEAGGTFRVPALIRTAVGGTAAVTIEQDGTILLVAENGSNAPGLGAGAKIKAVRAPGFGGGTESVFSADLVPGLGGVTTTDATALFGEDSAFNLGLREQRADAAPNAPGATFLTFGNPVMNTTGQLAFSAKLMGTVTSADSLGLWSDFGGSLALIARKSAEPAGIPSAQWLSFSGIGLPDDGGVIFAGKLTRNIGGVDATNDIALSAVDSTTTQRLLLRKGQALAIGATTKTVSLISPLTLVPTSPAQRRAFNNHRAVVTLVKFTDGTQAIVRTMVP